MTDQPAEYAPVKIHLESVAPAAAEALSTPPAAPPRPKTGSLRVTGLAIQPGETKPVLAASRGRRVAYLSWGCASSTSTIAVSTDKAAAQGDTSEAAIFSVLAYTSSVPEYHFPGDGPLYAANLGSVAVVVNIVAEYDPD